MGQARYTKFMTLPCAFLKKFARRSPEKPRVKLFTTNYDLCIETAGLRLSVVLIDGFSRSAEQRFNRDHFNHDIVRRVASSTKADYPTVCSTYTSCTVRWIGGDGWMESLFEASMTQARTVGPS